jgi:hypothetical protein
MLTCVEQPSIDSRSTAIIAAVSAVAGTAVLCALLAVGILYLRTQPRWLRERVMQAKRLQGAPRAGKPGDCVHVSVVVTDVKGFSALTRQYPDAMIKAMGGHNNIMRKVRLAWHLPLLHKGRQPSRSAACSCCMMWGCGMLLQALYHQTTVASVPAWLQITAPMVGRHMHAHCCACTAT